MDEITRLGGGGDETVAAGASRPSGSDDATVLSSDEVTVLSSSGGEGGFAAPHLEPGQMFGRYRVERILGRGGMGEVYEAEHLDHGHRVALKVLTGRFTGPADRERFLREGELAASINHKHTVYVFGSEDIDGAPVIAMELLSGGTLRDRVQAQGALPPAEAVDITLQIVSGLAAAQAAGILHRDVKPANCFIDADGRVKVGDFGLSISTAAGQRSTGLFQGTPQYASPEQIRGEPLDVRADIYALGATLFYLLTGQPPFDDQDLTTLVTRVTAEAPRSPREMKSGVPEALATLVTRCLSKDRSARPESYAALEQELRAFSSVAPIPAPLGRRFAAGLADQVIYALFIGPLNLYVSFMYGPDVVSRFGPLHTIALVAYFGLLEGRGDASLGKRLFGLRVMRADGQPAGLARALGRAALYQFPAIVGLIPLLFVGPGGISRFALDHPVWGLASGLGSYLLLALLFSTARRRNGYAAIHDRLTGTRVVRRLRESARMAANLPASREPVVATLSTAGPFQIVGTLGTTRAGELLAGVDPRLKRQVWIHRPSPGTPALAPFLRDLGRPGRLRWLGGRRTPDETWDAYEAFEGVPLATLDRAQPWTVVRRWLLDLAREIDAGLADGSLTHLPLDISRVWVTPEGHARLVDLQMPGLTEAAGSSAVASLGSAQALLFAVAAKGLSGQASGGPTTLPPTLPLSARACLDALSQRALTTSADLVSRVSALVAQPDTVAPWRRAASVALCGVLVLLLAFTGFLAALVLERIAINQPDLAALGTALQRLSDLAADTSPNAARERDALEIYIAGRFRARIADDAVWNNPVSVQRLKANRALAFDVVARHPTVDPAERAAAEASLGSFMAEQDNAIAGQRRVATKARVAATGVMVIMGWIMGSVFGVILAFALRGGLFLRAFGLAVVGRNGARVSRLRAAFRAIVAWSPAAAAAGLGLGYGVLLDAASWTAHPVWTLTAVLAAGVFIGGGVFAMLRPTRSIQDYLAGTSIVPV